MAVYEVSDFRNGLKVEYEGIPYEVSYFQHVKPGKGNAFTRTKLRNLVTGNLQEFTFKSGEKFQIPDMEQREMNYMYADSDGYNLIDNVNFEQIVISKAQLGDKSDFLQEGITLQVLFYKGKPLDIELPNFVTVEIVEADPDVRGDTVSGSFKKAKIATGRVVDVPMFISAGEKVKIDTRDGRFVERVNK